MKSIAAADRSHANEKLVALFKSSFAQLHGAAPTTAGETPVYGNLTYSADISSYASQIMSIIPEPSTYALLALAGAAALWRVRRR